MTIETCTLATVSTAHLTPDERESLDHSTFAPTLHGRTVWTAEYGGMIWIGHEIGAEGEWPPAEASAGLQGAVSAARAAGADFLRFDRDADEMPGVSIYED